jgi:tetratricopeptide (TPR) repeat protein
LDNPAKLVSVKGSHRVRAPWGPTGIALITILFSPLPGGILHAINYARLGQPERKSLALSLNLITATIIFLASFYAERSTLGLAASITVAVYFYKSQDELFRRHRAAGGQRASLILPVILSLLGLITLVVGFSYAENVRYEKEFDEAIGLMEEGKIAEAERGFRAYQKAFPDDMASYWNLALLYEESGDIEKAAQELRVFITRNPNSQEVQEYLDRLESKPSLD